MSELAIPLRNQLSNVMKEARRVAEAGAKKVLESLAVERHEPHGSMPPEKRSLRNRLRARGRQLGDVRDRQRGHQSIGRLTHEVAYEHWHRMLFARFLAENGLLIHPEHQVAMSVRDIEELAHETGKDPHDLAASFAQVSLPQIFRTEDPVLEVTLAPETRQKLEALLDRLPTEVFTADDSLGWTYQYWQAEKKDAINASGEKIGADELPAVTQLFTEHYMVLFLYHNTLGAWHAGKVLADKPSLAETAQSEDELRKAVALKTPAGDSSWDYLRFVREPQNADENDNSTDAWRPAAGIFDGWPKMAKDLKVLDPSCGSGHFLVVGFKLLVRLRMHEEGLGLEEAINAVLRDNLYGLELDPRCTQIAAFNLAIAAWKLVGKPIELPPLNIACSGLSIGSSKKDWLALAGEDERLGAGLTNLYELFRQAPELGSLIDPKALSKDMFVADFEELQPLLEQALGKEPDDEEAVERAVAAQGMAKSAELLSGEYTLVITNVPYLGRGLQRQILRDFVDKHHKLSKADLATVFLDRCARFCQQNGTHATVSPQNWLFIKSYEKFRRDLLTRHTLAHATRIGSGATATASWDVLRALVIVNVGESEADYPVTGVESLDPSEQQRAFGLQLHPLLCSSQHVQIGNPDSRVILGNVLTDIPPLSQVADFGKGSVTGDGGHYLRKFWEVPKLLRGYRLWLNSPDGIEMYGGREHLVLWDLPGHNPAVERGFAHRGHRVLGKRGVALGKAGKIRPTVYQGELFDDNVAVLCPNHTQDLAALWSFCRSSEFIDALRALDSKLSVTAGTFTKVPFQMHTWHAAADIELPDGLPDPYSTNPTQWVFHGHPADAASGTELQVAVCRLLGYRWPVELSEDIRISATAQEWTERCGELMQFADRDGIVCLQPTRGEMPAAERLRSMLVKAFASDWSAEKERELLVVAAGQTGKPAPSLETWLRDKFFDEHCKLFRFRPFVWHIWDGNRDGFHCLVNAHKLTGSDGEGRRTLEAITYSYLGDWISRQEDEIRDDTPGADSRLRSAQELKIQLENILLGEPPYDLFVRWTRLQDQAVGWQPDPHDGIRLNIRPFMKAQLRIGGKKGAGILRNRPNIKWGPKPDRGKDVAESRPRNEFPWFWGCKGDGGEADRTNYTTGCAGNAGFDGNRWNDLHFSRAVKEAARASAKAKPEEQGE
jgi:hypothetical protein